LDAQQLYIQLLLEGDEVVLTNVLVSITLIMSRLQAFFYLSPFFNKTSMPRIVRFGIIFSLVIILLPDTYLDISEDENIRKRFLYLVAKEVLIGLVMGLIIWSPIRGLELSGTILDTQRGSMQPIGTDAVFMAQATPTTVLLLQLFSGYFFASGGYGIVQTAIFDSASIWRFVDPAPPLNSQSLIEVLKLAGYLFFSALAFALPISALMLLSDFIIAFIAKTAPTLNALTFGMPVKTGILCFMLFFYIEVAYPKLMISFQYTLQELDRALQ